jgi:hypothetical protein
MVLAVQVAVEAPQVSVASRSAGAARQQAQQAALRRDFHNRHLLARYFFL